MNIQKMMKQAQDLQKQMMKQQEELAQKTFDASSGGGMVTATVNGKSELTAIKIEKEVVNPEDVSMLQDLIVAAVTEAQSRAREAMEQGMAGLMGGMGKI
ncbi:MAG: YbaB/EbfC family nucleoid-associated protein, partial [Deltaproteobacteria bacterium]|nr:YbaB/EbfC family nucleoid-associated protein [Deltaproteobacteria bacterium]